MNLVAQPVGTTDTRDTTDTSDTNDTNRFGSPGLGQAGLGQAQPLLYADRLAPIVYSPGSGFNTGG